MLSLIIPLVNPKRKALTGSREAAEQAAQQRARPFVSFHQNTILPFLMLPLCFQFSLAQSNLYLSKSPSAVSSERHGWAYALRARCYLRLTQMIHYLIEFFKVLCTFIHLSTMTGESVLSRQAHGLIPPLSVGSSTVKTVSPPLSADTLPPCSSTTRLTTASPTPLPSVPCELST